MSEFAGLGFGIGVVRGVRSFDVTPEGKLLGVVHPHEWLPGENEARCESIRSSFGRYIAALNSAALATATLSATLDTSRSLPDSNLVDEERHSMATCSCGFYAYYDGSNDYRSDARVSAVVEGYGETVIGTRGFRAAKARIVALHVDEPKPRQEWKWWRNPYRWTVEKMLTRKLRLDGDIGGWGVPVGIFTAWLGIGIWLLAADSKSFDLYLYERYRVRPNPAKWYTPRTQARGLTHAQIDGIRRRFPDVPFFDSFDAMVAAFPPDAAVRSDRDAA